MSSKHISVVIPFYGCKACLVELHSRLTKSLSQITNNFEIILVNDASPENCWNDIKSLCQKDNRVVGLNFSRNFGQHYAIRAGLDYASGEWIVVMDCDLQDQPEEIIKLYEKTKDGYYIILGRRYNRQDTFFKEFGSIMFYKILSWLTDKHQNHKVANFGIYHRKVIDAVKSMRENLRYFPVLVRWTGFKTCEVDIEHAKRKIGNTQYSFGKLFKLVFDIVIAFSDKPLRLTVRLGLAISALSLIYAVVILVRVFVGDVTVEGWSSLIVSVWFLSGLIIFILGIIGIYLGKTFDEAKKRPIYIISDIARGDSV